MERLKRLAATAATPPFNDISIAAIAWGIFVTDSIIISGQRSLCEFEFEFECER